MEAPGFFILLVLFLALLFGLSMVTGAVWLFFGWRKKTRSVQLLSAVPFGIGIFIIGPLLLLAIALIGLWLLADRRGAASPEIPPAAAPGKSGPSNHVITAALISDACVPRSSASVA
jgi:hypothetical protein